MDEMSLANGAAMASTSQFEPRGSVHNWKLTAEGV